MPSITNFEKLLSIFNDRYCVYYRSICVFFAFMCNGSIIIPPIYSNALRAYKGLLFLSVFCSGEILPFICTNYLFVKNTLFFQKQVFRCVAVLNLVYFPVQTYKQVQCPEIALLAYRRQVQKIYIVLRLFLF